MTSHGGGLETSRTRVSERSRSSAGVAGATPFPGGGLGRGAEPPSEFYRDIAGWGTPAGARCGGSGRRASRKKMEPRAAQPASTRKPV
jgi:hypothetical protein